MRKRQWKKILSVVLALAMVFSMNITAFADPAPEGEAVEQPAAEEPAPAAEEPAADEEAPAAEPAEEKAPAAEETPAAQEPAPAEEAAPKEKSEEAVGTDGDDVPGVVPDGWTAELTTDAGSGSTWTGNTLYVKGTDVVTLDTAVPTTSREVITVNIENGATLEVDDTVGGVLTGLAMVDTTSYEPSAITASTSITGSPDEYTIVPVVADGSNYFDRETKAIYTNILTTGYRAFEASTYRGFTLTPVGITTGAIVAKAAETGTDDVEIGTSAKTLYIVDESDCSVVAVTIPKSQTAPANLDSSKVTKTHNTITVDTTKEIGYKLHSAGSYTVATSPITGLTAETAYDVNIREAANTAETDAAAFPSDWAATPVEVTMDAAPSTPGVVGDTDEMTVDSTFKLDADGEYFTVSGLAFTAEGGAATGSGVSDNNGIFKVSISSGTIRVTNGGTQEAVSINVIKEGNLIIDGEDGALMGSLITVEGTRTVSFDATGDSDNVVFADNLYEVKGVKLSANAANQALLVSGNKIKEGFSVYGEDQPMSLAGKDLKISIAKEATSVGADLLWNDTYGIDLGTGNLTTNDAWFVLSDNKTYNLGSGADINLEECDADDAMGFGKTVIFSSDKDLDDDLMFKKMLIPSRFPMEQSLTEASIQASSLCTRAQKRLRIGLMKREQIITTRMICLVNMSLFFLQMQV